MSNLYGAKEAKRCRVMLNSLSPVKEYLVSNLDVVDWAFMTDPSSSGSHGYVQEEIVFLQGPLILGLLA